SPQQRENRCCALLSRPDRVPSLPSKLSSPEWAPAPRYTSSFHALAMAYLCSGRGAILPSSAYRGRGSRCIASSRLTPNSSSKLWRVDKELPRKRRGSKGGDKGGLAEQKKENRQEEHEHCSPGSAFWRESAPLQNCKFLRPQRRRPNPQFSLAHFGR